MPKVYLGLGSNLGDREDHIRRAVKELSARGVTIRRMSTIIETDPVGGPAQGKFLNAVAECLTDLAPQELLTTLQRIEKDLGRVRTVPNGPRTIDLDILLYDDLTLTTPDLTIPHPRMKERPFVMGPLFELAPAVAARIERVDDPTEGRDQN